LHVEIDAHQNKGIFARLKNSLVQQIRELSSQKSSIFLRTLRIRTGGLHAVAARLGWRTQRRERAALRDLEAAAAELAEFIEQLPRSRMPTHAQLSAAGRHDLRYALQVWS